MFYQKPIPSLFDSSVQSLSTRCFVHKKEELVYLRAETSSGSLVVKEWVAELGQVAADFLCDDHLSNVCKFLSSSEELVHSIKADPNNVTLWKPFVSFVISCLEAKNLHPFYYPLIAEIVNAYHNGMKDSDGNFLSEDHFSKFSNSLFSLHERIANVTRICFHRDSKKSTAKSLFIEHGFYVPLKLSDVFFQFVTLPPSSPEDDHIPHPQLVLHPKSAEDVWNFLCAEYLATNILLIPCESCKRFFVATGRSNVKYCTRTLGDTGRTCRDIMPEYVMRIKLDNSPAERLFKSAYKTMYSRVTAGKYTKEQFKEWSIAARQMRNSCTAGSISFDDFVEWLQQSGL